MFWRILLAITVGALAFALTAPAQPPPRRRKAMNPITTRGFEKDSEMGDPAEYEVLRDHGAKSGGDFGPAFRKGETRQLRPEEALPLIRAGVLRGREDEGGEKMEERPLNKAEEPPAATKQASRRTSRTEDDDA